MSERYVKLFEGEKNLYLDGSPVIISARALLSDKQTNNLIAQVKYRSVTEKTISYLKIKLLLSDALNNVLPYEEFEYKNLSVEPFEQFGQKVPVVLSNKSAYSYTINVVGAAFSDGSIWVNEISDWRADPLIEKEASFEAIYRKATIKMNSASSEDEYKFAALLFKSISEYKDAKALSEHCLELAETFRKNSIYNEVVSMKAATAQQYYDVINKLKSISGWKDADKIIEAKQKELYAIKLKEKQKLEEYNKKRKALSIVCFIIAIAGVLLIFGAIFGPKIIKNINYNSAVKLYNEGRYEEALKKFRKLDGYRDEDEYILKCTSEIINEKYNTASRLYNEGKYDEALSLFEEIDEYKDSTEIIAKLKLILKYHWIKTAKVGDHVHFGSYEQDNNPDNGNEDIEWIVLAEEKERIMIISQKCIDFKRYNIDYQHFSWEDSSLCMWLNNVFINTAFDRDERELILQNEKNGCKIFILNYEEITKYMDTAEKRICLPTEYALQRSKNVIAAGNYRWWLRTDDSSFGTNYVDKDGTIVYASKNDTHATYFVRPVLLVIK